MDEETKNEYIDEIKKRLSANPHSTRIKYYKR